MRLMAYRVTNEALSIRAARPQRQWMDETRHRAAYFCLPLLLANTAGWELLNPCAFSAEWDGDPEPRGLRLRVHEGEHHPCAKSHFGDGILTFSTGYLFRTEPGHNLLVKGPPNHFKDALCPLEAVIETDWLPYTFTMNWKFTRPHQRVTFAAGSRSVSSPQRRVTIWKGQNRPSVPSRRSRS